MSILSRFILLGLLASIMVSHTASAATYIRRDASTAAAQADLAALAKAMKIMKDKGCEDPLSWYYQGAMHWTPDAASLKVNPFCKSFNASDPSLKWAWNTCASHNSEGPPSGIHFLTWHRLYVSHLEKIVRKLSGKSDFALPYWNYVSFNPVSIPSAMMPGPFRQPADPAKNALYTASRLDSLLQGKPIDEQQNVENMRDAREALENSSYKTFNTYLNSSIHGNMHDYIGGPAPKFNEILQTSTGGGMMGDIKSAGFDPIFWMHHSNVDRLFQQWTDSQRGAKVTMADLNSVKWPYWFYDENGTRVTYTMDQVLAITYNVDYVYDDQTSAPDKVVAQLGEPAAATEVVLSSAAINEVVAAKGVEFNMDIPQAGFMLEKLTADQAPATSIVLELETSFTTAPKGRYEVYVNLPKGEMGKADQDKHYAGAMHFFVIEPKDGQKGTHTFRFDLTDELNDPAVVDGKDNGELAITVIHAGDNTSENPTIEKATVYRSSVTNNQQ